MQKSIIKGAKKVQTFDTKRESRLKQYCPMRNEIGNCLPCGGYCTSNSDEFCEAVHSAYSSGKFSILELIVESIKDKRKELVDLRSVQRTGWLGVIQANQIQKLQIEKSALERLAKKICKQTEE